MKWKGWVVLSWVCIENVWKQQDTPKPTLSFSSFYKIKYLHYWNGILKVIANFDRGFYFNFLLLIYIIYYTIIINVLPWQLKWIFQKLSIQLAGTSWLRCLLNLVLVNNFVNGCESCFLLLGFLLILMGFVVLSFDI